MSLLLEGSWELLNRAATTLDGTKNEDNDFFPQGKNLRNRVIFDSILDTQILRKS